jgi:hypothetical protein
MVNFFIYFSLPYVTFDPKILVINIFKLVMQTYMKHQCTHPFLTLKGPYIHGVAKPDLGSIT